MGIFFERFPTCLGNTKSIFSKDYVMKYLNPFSWLSLTFWLIFNIRILTMLFSWKAIVVPHLDFNLSSVPLFDPLNNWNVQEIWKINRCVVAVVGYLNACDMNMCIFCMEGFSIHIFPSFPHHLSPPSPPQFLLPSLPLIFSLFSLSPSLTPPLPLPHPILFFLSSSLFLPPLQPSLSLSSLSSFSPPLFFFFYWGKSLSGSVDGQPRFSALWWENMWLKLSQSIRHALPEAEYGTEWCKNYWPRGEKRLLVPVA